MSNYIKKEENNNVNNHDENIKNIRLVLAGNPNVGKSVFFNLLTGVYVDISNFPGTTIDISRGKYKNYIVEDTPGIYGVSSFNDEERVARDIILNADIILNVVNGAQLQRDLFLTQQLIDMGKRVIVALNMMDEAKKNGINIDINKLSSMLGVPVFATISIKNQGVDVVKKNIETACKGNKTPLVTKLLKSTLKNKTLTEAESLLILEDDPVISKRTSTDCPGMREQIYKARRKYVDEIVAKAVTVSNSGASFSTILGRLMLNPATGIPMLIFTLTVFFFFIGVFVAQFIVSITEDRIMEGIYKPYIVFLLGNFIPKGSFLNYIFIGEYGLLTLTPVYVLGLLLPLVLGFYLALSILEDSGYLPRIATLLDRVLSFIGLNGKAIIPIILGFGCVTMATMSTRILGSRRERIIATALLGLSIPCSAQFGIVMGLLGSLGIFYTILYFIIIFLTFALTGTVLNKFLPGESSQLLIDLPPLRIPKIKNILTKTYNKSKSFLIEATPLFAIGSIILSLLKFFGILESIQNFIYPVTVGWLQLPKEASNIFIMGIVRRDFGAAGLTDLSLTQHQLLVSLVAITLFVPCIASIIVIFKERSKLEAFSIWFGSMFFAFTIGGLLSRLLNFIPF